MNQPTSASDNPGPLKTIAVNGVILIVCLLFIEIAIRLFIDPGTYEPTGVHNVDRSRDIAFIPNTRATYESSEFKYAVNNNSYGRRDVEWTESTLADPENILFIGDSMVLGNGVDHENTAPSKLEVAIARNGQPREVFNYGMPAGAPPRYKVLLDDALKRGVAARTIVVGLTIVNDFGQKVLKPNPIVATPDGKAPKRPFWSGQPELVTFVKRRVSHSATLVGWMLTIGRWLGVEVYDSGGSWVFLRKQTPEQERDFQRVLDFVGQMKIIAQANGRNLYAVIFPNRIQVENGDDVTGAIYDAEKPNRLILEYCDKIGLECLDMLPSMREAYVRTGSPIYFPIDRHPNERGYEVAAETIYAFLAEREPGLRGGAGR